MRIHALPLNTRVQNPTNIGQPKDHQMEMMSEMEMPSQYTSLFCEIPELPSPVISVGASSSNNNNVNYFSPHRQSFLINPQTSSPPNPPTTISFTNISDHPIDESAAADGLSPPPPPEKQNSMAAMREVIFRIAAMRPVHIDPESVKPPKRRNVKISNDPQSVAARHRRERISERMRILQRLVPGGTKMDTASMLDEAVHYLKFLKRQVQSLQRAGAGRPVSGTGFLAAAADTCGSTPRNAQSYAANHHA